MEGMHLIHQYGSQIVLHHSTTQNVHAYHKVQRMRSITSFFAHLRCCRGQHHWNVPAPLLTLGFVHLPLQDSLLFLPFLYKNEKFTAILLLLLHPSADFHIHSSFQHLLIHLFNRDNRLHLGEEKEKFSSRNLLLLFCNPNRWMHSFTSKFLINKKEWE